MKKVILFLTLAVFFVSPVRGQLALHTMTGNAPQLTKYSFTYYTPEKKYRALSTTTIIGLSLAGAGGILYLVALSPNNSQGMGAAIGTYLGGAALLMAGAILIVDGGIHDIVRYSKHRKHARNVVTVYSEGNLLGLAYNL